jgi:hypothetical protein
MMFLFYNNFVEHSTNFQTQIEIMPKFNIDKNNQERQVLETRLKSLTNRKQQQLYNQFDESTYNPRNDYKKKRRFNDNNRTIYEKYNHMWRENTRKQEDSIFNNESSSNANEDEEDSFFLDPKKESHQKVLIQNEKLVKKDLTKIRKKKKIAINIKPYENKSFYGNEGQLEQHYERPEKVKYGKDVCTPPYSQMIELDPKNWKCNVNFIPIPRNRNKLIMLLNKRQIKSN